MSCMSYNSRLAARRLSTTILIELSNFVATGKFMVMAIGFLFAAFALILLGSLMGTLIVPFILGATLAKVFRD